MAFNPFPVGGSVRSPARYIPKKRKALAPGSRAYMEQYGAGTGWDPYAIMPTGLQGVGGRPAGLGGRGPARSTRSVRTTTAPASGRLTSALATATGNPWDSYLATIDKRESDLMERMLRSRHQSTEDYMGALAGFGGAISGTAADAWGRALGGYERAADAQGAYQGAVMDDYSKGLSEANAQIARDYAAIGQAGPAAIRDTAAAAQQVGTVGGENPAGTIGLVGKSWQDYAKTVPGNIDFMTRQNIDQAMREGATAEDEIRNEFMQMAADNPQQAMEMWQAVNEFNTAKSESQAKLAQQKIDNARQKVADARAARAFELQIQGFNLKYGDAMADRASQLAKDTGTVWVYNPKTGQFDDTGRATEARRKANVQAGTTRRGQDIGAATSRRGQDISAATASANRLQKGQIAGVTARLRERGLDIDEAKANKDENEIQTMSLERRAILGNRAGKIARAFFQGDEKAGIAPGQGAEKALQMMRGENIPLSISLDAIAAYAYGPNSRWAYAKPWRRPLGQRKRLSQGAGNAPR